jgi:hypothetical protein
VEPAVDAQGDGAGVVDLVVAEAWTVSRILDRSSGH